MTFELCYIGGQSVVRRCRASSLTISLNDIFSYTALWILRKILGTDPLVVLYQIGWLVASNGHGANDI